MNIFILELFIKNKENVHAALDLNEVRIHLKCLINSCLLLQETDFNLRRSAIKFVTVLLTNCTKVLQDIILESGPMGVSKLVDLLQDEREVIRNDVNFLPHEKLTFHILSSIGFTPPSNLNTFKWKYSKNSCI
jgi:hypothetical protein